MIRTAIVIFLVAAPQVGRGQAQPPPEYFPLEVGNWWRQAYVDTQMSPPDTFLSSLHEVLEEVEVNGRSYFRLSSHVLDTDLVRSDSLRRIWGYRRGEEHLLFDFTAADDSTYFYPFGEDDPYEVRVRHGRTVQTLAGSFSDCVSFDFDIPEALDDEMSYAFAPGVGLVTIGGAWEFGSLLSATVGGVPVVTAIEKGRRGSGLSAAVYPVPVVDHAQLEIESASPGLVMVSVHDVLGRKLLADQRVLVSAGRARHVIDLGGFAAGLYFYRIRHENGQAQTVVVPRQ